MLLANKGVFEKKILQNHHIENIVLEIIEIIDQFIFDCFAPRTCK